MKSIFAATLLAICIAAQEREEKEGQEIDWDNMPDKLCSGEDENCWEWQNDEEALDDPLPDYKREQEQNEIDWDNMPDKLCSDGQFGCHDWLNDSAIGLKTAFATIAFVATSSALTLAF